MLRKTLGLTRRLLGTTQIQAEICRLRQQLAQASPPPPPPPAPAPGLGAGMQQVRALVADSYLRGRGIEIGAFASPLPLPAGASVQFVDKLGLPEVEAAFSIAGLKLEDFGVSLDALVRPDIVDDGETLASIGDYSQDFVVANHVLEHFEDPIKGFRNMLRVLRHGGMLYLALPEMRHSFDRIRPETPFEHILRDYHEGPAGSRRQAYAEFARIFVNQGLDKGLFPKVSGAERTAFEEAQAQAMERANFSIHFHAWSADGMQEMFLRIKTLFHLAFETRLMLQNGDEVIFVFEKTFDPPR